MNERSKAFAKAFFSVFQKAEWNEDDHPRDEDGKFSGGQYTDGGASAKASARNSKAADRASLSAEAKAKEFAQPKDKAKVHEKAAGAQRAAIAWHEQAARMATTDKTKAIHTAEIDRLRSVAAKHDALASGHSKNASPHG